MDIAEYVNTVEWFFGYGGTHIGLKRVFPNLRLVAACEIESYALANMVDKMEKGLLDSCPIWTDCKTFPTEPFKGGTVDLFVASYPCQPFSAAGKRLGCADPRHLWPYVKSFIRACEPRWVFLENVEGHISKGLTEVLADLEEMAYTVKCGVFSAAEVGAPHQRKRVFILAESDGEGCKRHQLPETESSGKIGGFRSTVGPTTVSRAPLWPSRPGEAQHGWEEPRVVNSESPKRWRPGDKDNSGWWVEETGGPDGTHGPVGQIKSELGRVPDGSRDRVDRLRLLGNGVVPQQAEKAFRYLIRKFE